MIRVGDSITIQTLCEQYLATHPLARRKVKLEQECISRWWMSHWGSAQVETLTHAAIATMGDVVMRQGNRETTMRHYLRFFRKACAWGVTVGHLLHNPCEGFPLPKDYPGIFRILTEAEEERLGLALGAPGLTRGS